MKSLTCEMCGGTELIKQDGVFICQACGIKYSVEEAKKMMIDGPVDVSGSTVRVDNSDFVEKSLANARRAKLKEDWEETEKYYNLVEQNDPTNIEAVFYSAFGKAKQSLIDSNRFKREDTFKVLTNCVSLIDDCFSFEKETENKDIISQISDDIHEMTVGSFVVNQTKDGYGTVISSDKQITETLFDKLEFEFVNTLENIIAKYSFGDNRTIPYYKMAVEHLNYIIARTKNPNTKSVASARANELHAAWNRLDAFHPAPIPKPITESKVPMWYLIVAAVFILFCFFLLLHIFIL